MGKIQPAGGTAALPVPSPRAHAYNNLLSYDIETTWCSLIVHFISKTKLV